MTTTTPTTTASTSLTGSYALDPAHSRLGFVARHAMVTKVRGAFGDVSGTGWFDAEDPSRSHAEVTIRVASIDTGNADRDAHLRSSDFFAIDTYPEIRFVTTAVEARGASAYRVTGDLTIKDVTKPVTFDLELTGAARDPFGNDRLGFEGSLAVNRRDWGLAWNVPLDTGGVLVSEKVTLELDVSAIKQ